MFMFKLFGHYSNSYNFQVKNLIIISLVHIANQKSPDEMALSEAVWV